MDTGKIVPEVGSTVGKRLDIYDDPEKYMTHQKRECGNDLL